ncbi:hypothetical protein QZH41_017764 [Actinostola sp. cb2023]|nr:hypothetical protein QZH41_017764 [Actinostola sp. cb2023]
MLRSRFNEDIPVRL